MEYWIWNSTRNISWEIYIFESKRKLEIPILNKHAANGLPERNDATAKKQQEYV